MQQMPIIAVNTPPAATAQTAAAADAATPTETFETVFARQRAGTDAQEEAQSPPRANGKPDSAADQTAARPDATEETIDDTPSTLPEDLLAALLPPGEKAPDAGADTAPAMTGMPTVAPITGHKTTQAKQPASNDADAQPGILPAAIPVTPDAVAAQEPRVPQKTQTLPGTGETPTASRGTQPPGTEEISLGTTDGMPVPPPTAPVAAPVANLPEPAALSGQRQEPATASARRPVAATTGDAAAASEPAKPSGARAQGGAARDATTAATSGTERFSAALAATETRNAAASGDAARTAIPETTPGPAQPLATTAASSASVTHAHAPTQLAVNTPLARQERWGDELGQKVTWLVGQREQSAELHLNPPNLGPLRVVINVSGDQASALFASPHAAVRDAVEQALPRLRDMLADSGITLGNATVSDQSQREQQAAWQSGSQQGGNASDSRDGSASADALPAGGIPGTPPRRHHGLVDTFA